MKRKLLALFSAILLLSSALPVNAASDLPITYGNGYTMSLNGGGTYEYVVPFTANYEISLAGAQGASYSNNAGGYGYTLSKTVRLKYQDVIKVVVPNRPSYSQSGSTLSVPGGQPAKLYLNDELIWTAAGGYGQISSITASSTINTVNVQSGNGTEDGAWPLSLSVHHDIGSSSHGGSGTCYTIQHWKGTRTRTKRCPGRFHVTGPAGGEDWCPTHGRCPIMPAVCDTCGRTTGFCYSVGGGYTDACNANLGT
ncbi:MAG: hypothetical protein NC489_46680, partial [Ruminococcus flavefaciens]|nr:hypothetical protein [Ruminococcus flavefaciens]